VKVKKFVMVDSDMLVELKDYKLADVDKMQVVDEHKQTEKQNEDE
jgi:hypothetical protein